MVHNAENVIANLSTGHFGDAWIAVKMCAVYAIIMTAIVCATNSIKYLLLGLTSMILLSFLYSSQ